MSAEIRFESVRLELDGERIVDGVDLAVAPGESVALIGRSGAGKTTLLRMVNGLVFPSGGRVLIDGVPTDEIDLIAMRRRSGYIIQEAGLFPHRTVLENVATVPRLRGWDPGQIESTAKELLDSVGLPFEEFRRRFPRTLSGGERQRVGIVRAMIAKPDILLCDEPFGALDPLVRSELQAAFNALRRELGTTVLFVTHDLREAMLVADRIVMIDGGRIVALGTPEAMRDSSDGLVRRFVHAAGLGREART